MTALASFTIRLVGAALLLAALCGARDRAKSKPIAYVYVGFGQATSTALQTSLCALVPTLAQDFNIHLPISSDCEAESKFHSACPHLFRAFAVGLRQLDEQHPIPEETVEKYQGKERLMCQGSLAGAVEDVRHWAGEAAKEQKNVFMASEGLGALTLHQISYLKDVFSDFEMRVLILVSNPIDYWVNRFVTAKKWGSGSLSDALKKLTHYDPKQVGMDVLFEAVQFYAKVTPSQVYVASMEGMARADVSVQEVMLKDFFAIQDTEMLLSEKDTGFNKLLTSPAIPLDTFEMVNLMYQLLPHIYRHELPSSAKAAAMKDINEGVSQLKSSLGGLWKCRNAHSDFKGTIREFGFSLRRLKDISLLYFDVLLTEDDLNYYKLDLEVCHGDLAALKADDAKFHSFILDLDRVWIEWKSKTG